MHRGLPNIRHMRVFLETVQTGSVSVAAGRCHLSQPAATQAIARLEADIGTPLLIRRRQQAGLTTCGSVFFQRATKALYHLNEGSRAALRKAGKTPRDRGTFELSVTASQLRNLIAIANSGSFTVAAKTLGLSQPTIHRTARSLEAVVGVPFFVTSPSGVQLTPEAEAIVLGAKLAENEIRLCIEDISRVLGQEKGTFVLGSLPLARTSIVPKAIHAMLSTTDGFQIRVVEGRYSELLRSLREGDIDCLIGALRYPAIADDIEQEKLFKDALTIVAHPSHPLVGRQNLSIDDTIKYPWVAPPKSTPAGRYLFETLRIYERDKTPVCVVTSSLAVLRGVLAEGLYISIISRHQIEIDKKLGTICELDVPLTEHVRDIGLSFRRDWQPTATQRQFLENLRSISNFGQNL